jgi:hypothetical protein
MFANRSSCYTRNGSGAFVRKIIGETLGFLDFLCIFALAKRFSKTNNYKIIESMKRFSTLLLLVACAVMAQAQKLDTQLMLLVGQSGTRGEQVVTNQKVLQDKLCANLNADSKNKPAVINISMGTGTNLHDGSSLICKTINKLTQNGSKAGRVVVMSARLTPQPV